MNELEKTEKAAKHVDALLGFYIHLVIFVLVNAVLLAVNWVASPDKWWVQWPFIGWGIGIVLHALLVFGSKPNFIANWRLRKIKQMRDRM